MFAGLQRSIPHYIHKSKPSLGINPIRILEKERTTAQLSRQNLQSSLEEFHRNGLVILENAVGHLATDHIHQKMLDDFRKHGNSLNIHWNQGEYSGNISQTPPLLSEYLHEEIWANRLAINIMEHLIGPKPQLSFATSNIVLPRTRGRQAVHSDYYCSHFNFPVFLEVCIYPQSVDSRNGSTEFWLGTHQGYSKKDHTLSTTGWIKRNVFTPRAKISPPVQPDIPKGSLCIRDLRCWHAARENLTDVPRIILGFIYSPQWFDSHMRMKFPSEARKCLEMWEHIDCLKTAEFVEGEFDYLEFNQNLNLTQTPSDSDAAYVPQNRSTKVTPEDYWTP